MFPEFTQNNFSRCVSIHAEHASQRYATAYLSAIIQAAHIQHVLFCQLRSGIRSTMLEQVRTTTRPMAIASWHFLRVRICSIILSSCRTAFSYTVFSVLFLSALKQMIRMTAWLIVAMMAYVKAKRIITRRNEVCDAVHTPRSTIQPKHRIVLSVFSNRCPALTFWALSRRLIDFRPKALYLLRSQFRNSTMNLRHDLKRSFQFVLRLIQSLTRLSEPFYFTTGATSWQ